MKKKINWSKEQWKRVFDDVSDAKENLITTSQRWELRNSATARFAELQLRDSILTDLWVFLDLDKDESSQSPELKEAPTSN